MPLATQDGREVEVEFVSNVYDEAGQSVIQCNIRDITARRALEQRAQEQSESLADLHRRKDEFLAMLSHELRNPLASLANAVHLLQLQQDGNPIQLKARSTIERQVGLLTRLVDDLLEVSRITSGRIRLQREPLAVNSVVNRAVDTVRPLLSQHGHEISVTLPSDPIWLYADAARMDQVLVNLLTNAAKYTNDGGTVSISARQDGQECLVAVRDSGVGMPPELLPHIFDLFTQADRSLGRSQGGLGIGLAVVQQLVEMHGGMVNVHSALGHGSEFIVRLPVGPPPDAPPMPIPPRKEGVHPNSGRVLVVDDNVDVGESFALLLQEDGYEARAVFDGPAALAEALQFAPHVVLLDIGMPGWDGYEVARRMRENPLLQDVMLVALTGYGRDSDRKRSLDAGFAHHLVKPVSLEEVTEILATVPGVVAN
jgi:signal transduction histidine kinase/CheY-like chemotaxis protein